jgi:hypothetical protein
LECLALAHEVDKLGVGGAALVDAMFVFSEQFFESATTFLGEHLIDFALGEAVLISIIELVVPILT